MPRRVLSTQEYTDISERFTYHPPKGDQTERYLAIREKAKELAFVMAECCPPGRELATALTQLTLVSMLANSAIAIGEK